MARVFIDGFETGDLSHWDYNANPSYTSIAAVGATGLNGSYYLYAGAGGGHVFKNLPSALTELWMCVWYRVGNIGSDTKLIQFRNSSNTVLGCVGVISNRFHLLKGDNATDLGTGTTVVSNSTVYKLEIRYKPHLTSGVFELKVNGAAAEISVSGVSTSPSTEDVTRLSLVLPAYNGFDNVIVDNAAYPGILSNIIALVPNANGSLNEFTPSAGSQYECVDEQPPSSTDYVGINAVDKTELYAKAAVPGAVYQVKSVQIHAKCVKEGAATPTTMKLAVKPDATTHLSTAQAIGLTSAGIFKLWETNPETGLAWTVEQIDATEFGIKSAA